MAETRMIGRALSSLAETTWRRLRGEPVAESWPFRFEWFWGVLRKTFLASRGVPPHKIRRVHEKMAREPEDDVARIETTVGGVDCEWFLADPGAATEPEPETGAIVYLHGGGFIFGSTNTHADLLARLTRQADLPVLGVNYRLCPEHDLGDAIDDVVAVFSDLGEQGWRTDSLALAGDSAGGGLAVSSTMALRDRSLPLPAALVLLSPWVDMRCDATSYETNSDTDYMTGEMIVRASEIVLDGRSPDLPVASPVCGELEGLPPTLVHAGGAEVLLDDSRRLAEAMERAGVDVTLEVWPEMVHVFQSFARFLPQSREALDEIARFLAEAIDGEDQRNGAAVRAASA